MHLADSELVGPQVYEVGHVVLQVTETKVLLRANVGKKGGKSVVY